MSFQHFLTLVALACVVSGAAGFKITDCTIGKKADAKLIGLSISTCPDNTGDRCDFIKGKNATMNMDFEPTVTFKQANISISAVIGRLHIPFSLPGPKNACGVYGFDCPVQVGIQEHMKISLPVQRIYPSIKAVVRFELNDEKAQPIVCFEFPVQIKSAAN